MTPFLACLHVPDERRRRLTQAERDLHLLWVKKFAPLFSDYDRLPPEHLPAGDRRRIRRVLAAIASRAIPFGPRLGYVSGRGTLVDFVRGETRIEGEALTVKLIAETSPDEGAAGGQRLSLQAYGARTDVEVVLDWRPQDDPGRGSVYLAPQAARSKHRFAIAAFNARQFAGLCRALIEYATGQAANIGGEEMAEVEVGTVSDYFAHVGAAGIELSGELAVGDAIHIKGHTTDVTLVVASMQIEHEAVQRAGPGDPVGIKVPDRCRPGDLVYKVTG